MEYACSFSLWAGLEVENIMLTYFPSTTTMPHYKKDKDMQSVTRQSGAQLELYYSCYTKGKKKWKILKDNQQCLLKRLEIKKT